MSECSELAAEMARLRADVQALSGKFATKEELVGLRREIDRTRTSLERQIKAAFDSAIAQIAALFQIVNGIVTDVALALGLRGRVENLERGIARLDADLSRATTLAGNAMLAARTAKELAIGAGKAAGEALSISREALNLARLAQGTANAARARAEQALNLANDALSKVIALGRIVAEVSRIANEALIIAKVARTMAMDAFGAANAARARAEQALNLANDALSRAILLGNELMKLISRVDRIDGSLKAAWAAIVLHGISISQLEVGLAAMVAAMAWVNGQIAALWAAIRALALRPGPAGPAGPRGPQGQTGRDGNDGRDGKTPKFSIKRVEVLAPGQNPQVVLNSEGQDYSFIFRLPKGAQVFFEAVNVPIVNCSNGEPSSSTTQVSVIRSERGSMKRFAEQLFGQIADLKSTSCSTTSAIAAVPEWWAMRLGSNRPQMVVIWREKLPSGKWGKTTYSMSIPHYNQPASFVPEFPPYIKGDYMARLELSDNSKFTVYCQTEQIAESLVTYVKTLIDPTYIYGSKVFYFKRPDASLKEVQVYPYMGAYFSTGQRELEPNWRIFF